MRGFRLIEANRRAEKLIRILHKDGLTAEEFARFRGTYRKTPKPCSCSMCGHTRKHCGLTIQELRQEQESI